MSIKFGPNNSQREGRWLCGEDSSNPLAVSNDLGQAKCHDKALAKSTSRLQKIKKRLSTHFECFCEYRPVEMCLSLLHSPPALANSEPQSELNSQDNVSIPSGHLLHLSISLSECGDNQVHLLR